MKATNGSAYSGGEYIDVAIKYHQLDEIKAKLSSGTKNQDTDDFIKRVKGDLAALGKHRTNRKLAKETLMTEKIEHI